MHVDFTTKQDKITDYAVVLTIVTDGTHTVRLYDGAHGFNELHRYSSTAGKQPGEAFHHGTLGEGMRWAIQRMESGYEEMIEAWRERT
ncbi:MAG TPA: hypothetical protein VHS55_00980 [Solirubrobacteraceae bacterium]|jgi:hypothetical protein|nr:hypothetical protein [Solirubrobacteraceae bacterium]